MSVLPVKVVLLGATQVGKTAISSRFVTGSFENTTFPTVGVAFQTKTIKIANNSIQFEIWDTAGQEKFKSVTLSYVRGAHVVLCVYDTSKPETAKQALESANDAKDKLGDKVIIVMVGNKADLSEEIPKEIINFANEKNYMSFVTSAKTGKFIHDMFYCIGKTIEERPDIFEQKSGCDVSLDNADSDRRKCC